MLIACSACQRQFDVGSHAPGSKLRCFCGASLTVPEQKPRDARMLHCSGCGAGLPAGSTDCGFCGASVGLGAKGLGEACPGCFSRLLADARFCSSCGLEIRPVAAIKALTDHDCPRCRQKLSECRAADASFVECTHCGGLWLGEETFRRLTESREKNAAPAILQNRSRAATAVARDPAEDLRRVTYLRCPVCSERMNRRNFAQSSGVILDWCRGHGLWFDPDELERILAFIAEGGLDRQREREKEQLESERRRNEAARRDRTLLPATLRDRQDRPPAFDLLGALATLVGRWLR
jgi:Zn-finger nucleic acid-binding protein